MASDRMTRTYWYVACDTSGMVAHHPGFLGVAAALTLTLNGFAQAPAAPPPAAQPLTLVGCIRQDPAAMPGGLPFRLTDARPLPVSAHPEEPTAPSSSSSADSTARGETLEAIGQMPGATPPADPYRAGFSAAAR